MGIVDTSVLIDYDRGYDEARDWWMEKIDEGWKIYVSDVSIKEMLKGIPGMPGNRRKNLEDLQSRFKEMRKSGVIYRILPVTKHIWMSANKLLFRFCLMKTPQKNGMEGLICDMLIAATALKKELTLFTKNLRDFNWINLKL